MDSQQRSARRAVSNSDVQRSQFPLPEMLLRRTEEREGSIDCSVGSITTATKNAADSNAKTRPQDAFAPPPRIVVHNVSRRIPDTNRPGNVGGGNSRVRDGSTFRFEKYLP